MAATLCWASPSFLGRLLPLEHFIQRPRQPPPPLPSPYAPDSTSLSPMRLQGRGPRMMSMEVTAADTRSGASPGRKEEQGWWGGRR